MPIDEEPIEIVVCMGSSCFARGNADNLEALRRRMSAQTGRALRLKGSLCQDQCRKSPNIKIAGKMHHGVKAETLDESLLQHNESWSECWSVPVLQAGREEHGTA
jgi:NADH:ubiquinone oxidoreductase subunit E